MNIFITLFALAAVIVSAALYIDNQSGRVEEFEARCTAKGGVVLQAYKSGAEWIGCYAGPREIPNEVAGE